MTKKIKRGFHVLCAECDRVMHFWSQSSQLIMMKIHENDGHCVAVPMGRTRCDQHECTYTQPVDNSVDTPK
jgi:hypothetical protein